MQQPTDGELQEALDEAERIREQGELLVAINKARNQEQHDAEEESEQLSL